MMDTLFHRFRSRRGIGRLLALGVIISHHSRLALSPVPGIIKFLLTGYSESLRCWYKRHILVTFNAKEEVLWAGKAILEHDVYNIQCPKDNPVIVDIGANIGIATLSFKRQYPKSNIFAFEPIRTSYKTLVTNVRLNGHVDIICVNAAVTGNRAGRVRLYVPDDVSLLASRYPSNVTSMALPFRTRYVQAIRLKDVLAQINHPKIDILKIDAEGEEIALIPEILRHAHRINSFVMEMHLYPQHKTFVLLRQLSERYALAVGTSNPLAGISSINTFLSSRSYRQYSFLLYGVRRGVLRR